MIYITGDLFLGNKLINIDKKILEELDRDDNIIIFNLESIILDEPNLRSREDKSAILYTSKKAFLHFIHLFKKAELFFNLGNNHLHDYGDEGIRETLSFLDEIGVKYFGCNTQNMENFVLSIIDNNRTYSFISCSTSALEVMSITNNDNNIFYVKDIKYITPSFLEEEKKTADFIVILPHWGKEYIPYPTLENLKVAKSWVKSKADYVVGSHPHIIQGKAFDSVYFSLGNFFFSNFKKKNKIWHLWKNKSRKNIIVKLKTEGNNIKDECLGLTYRKNKVSIDKTSISNFEIVSRNLASFCNSDKKYYGFFEIEYYKYLRSNNLRFNKYKHFIIQISIKVYEKFIKKNH